MREYWSKERRFPAELAEEFKIGGRAPTEATCSLIQRKRYSEEAIRQCGLFFHPDDAQ